MQVISAMAQLTNQWERGARMPEPSVAETPSPDSLGCGPHTSHRSGPRLSGARRVLPGIAPTREALAGGGRPTLAPTCAVVTATCRNVALRATDFSARVRRNWRSASVLRLGPAAAKGALSLITEGAARGDRPSFRFSGSRVLGRHLPASSGGCWQGLLSLVSIQ